MRRMGHTLELTYQHIHNTATTEFQVGKLEPGLYIVELHDLAEDIKYRALCDLSVEDPAARWPINIMDDDGALAFGQISLSYSSLLSKNTSLSVNFSNTNNFMQLDLTKMITIYKVN